MRHHRHDGNRGHVFRSHDRIVLLSSFPLSRVAPPRKPTHAVLGHAQSWRLSSQRQSRPSGIAAGRAKETAAQSGSVWSSCQLIGVINLVIRYFELRHLNCDWSLDAYGSAVWLLMGLHVTHLLTDLVDTIVLTVLFFTSKVEGKRFMDASENADYWYFVVVHGFRSTWSSTGCRGGCMSEDASITNRLSQKRLDRQLLRKHGLVGVCGGIRGTSSASASRTG